MTSTVVMKFGGSNFIALTDYRRVALHLRDEARRTGARLVVVVSGMSGTTNRLLEAATTIDPGLRGPVRDQVLATGEMLSTSFLRAALDAVGISAIDLWAPQLGITSDSAATEARITHVDPAPVCAALADNEVVVAAGGQAVNPQGRVTMLGRNSSDLTAIALAAALGLDICQIYSDVPGVYTADPHLVPTARLIAELSHDQCLRMSRRGAKVMHHRAVEHARAHGVRIECRMLGAGGPVTGTVIGGKPTSSAVVVAAPAGPGPTRALTVLGPDGEWAERPVAHDAVGAEMRAEHERLYPGSRAHELPAKRYSPHSTVMLGGGS